MKTLSTFTAYIISQIKCYILLHFVTFLNFFQKIFKKHLTYVYTYDII